MLTMEGTWWGGSSKEAHVIKVLVVVHTINLSMQEAEAKKKKGKVPRFDLQNQKKCVWRGSVLFLDRVLCNSSWPGTCFVTWDDFELLLIFLVLHRSAEITGMSHHTPFVFLLVAQACLKLTV